MRFMVTYQKEDSAGFKSVILPLIIGAGGRMMLRNLIKLGLFRVIE
jgi:hypothetical protein